MNSIRIIMMNDTSLVRGVEELIATSLLFEETQGPAPTGMTIREVPFAPWMIVILCLIAIFVIDILSPAEQVQDINDGFDSDGVFFFFAVDKLPDISRAAVGINHTWPVGQIMRINGHSIGFNQ